MKEAGVEIIRGEATFVGQKRLAVGDREITAERIVIATGSRPSEVPFAELPVWTSDSLFPLNGTSQGIDYPAAFYSSPPLIAP